MADRPNILIFMTDHQRGDTILRGSGCITPNIDRFRKRAVNFTNAYCPSPHCCPSRATFFTGLYPSGHGVWNNVDVGNTLSRGLFDNVRTFSEDLKESGYNLYFCGKWHVSAEESPADRGFEMIYPKSGGYRKYTHTPDLHEWNYYNINNTDKGNEDRTEARIIREGYLKYVQYGIDENPFRDIDVASAAAGFLDEYTDENPFFLYAGVLGPHDPYFVPQRFLDLYPKGGITLPPNFDDDMLDKPVLYRRTQNRYNQLTREEHEECLRRFYAFCSYEDYLFGMVYDALEKSGQLENTLVLYCSDHGDYAGAHGLWAKGLPCFREAYNICCMAGGGGVISPDRDCDLPVSLADFAPTFLEITGVKTERRFDGRSIVPLLDNKAPADWRDYCFNQTNGNEVYGIQRAVWNKKWKYVFNTFDYDELYNLEDDFYELKNLIYYADAEKGKYGDIIREMCRKLWQFARESGDCYVNPYIMTALAPFGPGILL